MPGGFRKGEHTMHMRFLSVGMALALAADAAAAADPRSGTGGAPALPPADGAPLCRAVAPARQAETVPKESVTAARALCNTLAESVGKCVQLENTVVWLGLWQQAQAASPGYTNRLDFAELQRRIARLTAELTAHADQLQTLIRRQNAIGP